MSVKVRPSTRDTKLGFEVDIRFEWPDGTMFRRRRLVQMKTANQAQRWGEDLERRIFAQGKGGPLSRSERDAAPSAPETTNERKVPTLGEFWPQFIKGHCEGNRHKPSSVERKESAYRTWLRPRLGSKHLDEIGAADLVALKGDLAKLSAKSANNVLTSLSGCLKFAGPEGLRGSEGLGIIERVPRIRLLPIDKDDTPKWYEEEDFQRLLSAAVKISPSALLIVLLAGDAGLRKSEMAALKWTDLDLKRGTIQVRRSIWEGKHGKKHETTPKGGRGRAVTMTKALVDALSMHRHVRGPRVLYADSGVEFTDRTMQLLYTRIQRAAGLEASGGIHRLRHSFCSRLAAQGAPSGAIQKLAGHASGTTTQRYMHLSPTTLDAAIGLLDRASPVRGELVESAGA
jgi:integrase